MKFKELAKYLFRLEKTSSRLEITRILSELFRNSSPNEIDKVTYLSLGILAPSYEGVILNLAEKMMIRILTRAYGVSEEKVLSAYKKAGDMGNVAQELGERLKIKGKGFSVTEVYEKLVEIANAGGGGSQEIKIEKTAQLLNALDPESARFVSRIPIGKLRLGFSEKTIIDALSAESGVDKLKIEEVYNIRPDIGFVARVIKEKNFKGAKPKIGVPVVPMLAQRLNSPSEMVKKMGEVSVEPKFDGLRIFIHYRKNPPELKVFTRNMNAIDIGTFPELKEIGKYIKAEEIILDSEAIGVDPEREMFLDFQKTIQRRRKHEVEKTSSEIPLQFQIFDVLFVDGVSLIGEPYIKRRAVLKDKVTSGKLLRIDDNTITDKPEVIKSLHEKYLKMGLEGVVVKKANGFYVSGRTGWNWVKMKEAEGQTGKLSDTVDCIVMGYTQGKGKRAGFGVGQFLAGIRDGDVFKTVSKVGTGLTDDQFRELVERLKKIEVKEKPKEYEVNKDLAPDYWVGPKEVVELAADEITVSPKHTAGFALRFPRLVRFRDDKSPAQATTLNELKEIAKLQKKK